MRIVSWDVGVIHLAYCVLDFSETKDQTIVEIIDWDVINLIEDERIKMECCGHMKTKKGEPMKTCNKNATYVLNTGDNKSYGFCKTHLKQCTEYWSSKKTAKMFTKITPSHTCSYVKTDNTECGKVCKYRFNDNGTKQYYCTVHYKSLLNKKTKEYSPQPIRNLIVKKYQTAYLQLNLVKKLDTLAKHFAKLKIEEVIIENQPSQKNPKMKSISNTLFDYFMIRGYVDKIHNMEIELVRFMCPSNKLKVNNDNTIEVFKSNKDSTKKYKLTKALSIQYTKKLLEEDDEQLEYLDLYKKKDDICDAYLQGRYYLEFIKNKPTGSGSKTAKKKAVSRKGSVKKSAGGSKAATKRISSKKSTNKNKKKNIDGIIAL